MTLAYSTSTAQARGLAFARVLAAGRVRAERLAREREAERASALLDATGQWALGHDEWCYVCSRPTNHLGEHTPEQVEAWREGRGSRW